MTVARLGILRAVGLLQTVGLLWAVACTGDPKGDDPDAPGGTEPPTSETGPEGDRDGDGVADPDDCAPDDPTSFPGAPDACGDDLVTDCTRTSDDGLVTVGDLTTADLGAALAAARSGEEVTVCPGTYEGPFELRVPVVLTAHGARKDVVLSGGGLGRTLTVVDGTQIRGFTVTGGVADDGGGGIALDGGGTLTVEDCSVTGNHAASGGGIAVGTGAILLLLGTEIAENGADGIGGGLALGDGARATLDDASIRSNHAESGGGVSLAADAILVGGEVTANGAERGGGVWATGEVQLSDVVVRDNTAGTGGGAWIGDGTLTLTGDTEIVDNTAEGDGGGVAGERATVQSGTIAGNTATDGGGIWLTDGEIRGVEIRGNHVSGDGGGVRATCTDGGICDTDLLVDCEVSGNVAAGNGGGAWIRRDDGETAILEHDTFTGNGARSGGAVYAEGTALSIVDSEITSNTAETTGGGAWADGGADLASTGGNWGTGLDENLPSDVDYDGVSYASFGEEDFSCTVGVGCR